MQKKKRIEYIFFALSVGYAWVLVCRGEYCSPAKKYKDTFSLSYFCMTKSTKSHLRGLSSLLKNTLRVHELVARAMRGKCVRQRAERKSAVLPLPVASAIPRVRTYHTKKPSRFVHALSARPHNRVGGRGWSPCADGMKYIFFALSVSYTWAFACRGRRYPVSATPTHMLRICVNSHDDPLLSRGEHCSPAKKYKETFPLFALFTDEKRGKSHQRERSPLFENSSRVHELVARAMRGECVRQIAK